MTLEQAGRLLTLAWFLRTEVKEEEFDMGSYIAASSAVAPRLMLHPCGTTACALGWCTAVFPDRFRIGRSTFLCEHRNRWIRGVEFDENPVTYFDSPVKEFFGLTYRAASWLFGSEDERTPRREADLIEQVVFDNGYEYAP